MTLEAEQLPDVDEYDGLSLVEIGHAFVNWPEGSEDQNRALAAFLRRAARPGIGHNRPPLSEALEAETEAWRRRGREILGLAGEALIIDDESARKVSDLAAKCKDLEDELDAARLARTKPYRDATAHINTTYDGLIRPLKLAREGEDRRGGLRGMLTAWDNKVREAAAAEQRRLRQEQKQREAEAAEAQRRAEEAARGGQPGQVNAKLEAARAREAADQAQLRAEAVRPTPIRSHLGQVQRRREILFEVHDLGALIAWLISQPGLRGNVEQACRTIVGSYLRALGTDTVGRGVEIPGVAVRVELGTAGIRR